MAEQTFTAAAACAVLSEVRHGPIDAGLLRKWRTRGLWPIAGPLSEEQRWTRLTVADVARLYVMVQLNRHHGLGLEEAAHVAGGEKISFDEIDSRPDHYLVFSDDLEQVRASDIGHIITERDTRASSAVVVDLAKVFRRVSRRLEMWGDDPQVTGEPKP